MLHVFYGKGEVAVRQKAFAFVAQMEEEGFTLARSDEQLYAQRSCADLANSASLFGEKSVYLFDTPSFDAAFNADVVRSLPVLKDSAHVFTIIEGPLLAPEKKVFAKYADSIEEVSSEVKERFNAFALAESLLLKDKKTLWLQLQDARNAKLSAEEIIGTLWWQLKTLRIAAKTQSAAQAGMKDFTYNKAKRALKNFKDGELEALSRDLLLLYHEGHLGKKDINIALERWVLTM